LFLWQEKFYAKIETLTYLGDEHCTHLEMDTKPPRSTADLIAKIRSHPRFEELSILDRQEFDGAVYIWSNPSASSYTKAEERAFFVRIWNRLHETK
jgi:hypothetical protein